MLTLSKVMQTDIEEIHAIASSWLISGCKTGTEKGFLVSGYSIDNYKSFLTEKNTFIKAEKNGEILGFLYGYPSSEIAANDLVGQYCKANLDCEFFLIKQICVKKESPKTRGVADELYKYVTEQNIVLAAAIVTQPQNESSIKFHEKHGFIKQFEIKPGPDPDNITRPRGIWCRFPEKSKIYTRTLWHSASQPLDDIVDYHHTAVNLYTHEDNLNWKKLSMNTTFMLALLASMPYLSNLEKGRLTTWASATLIIFVGIFLNYVFGRKIKSGLDHMHQHKKSIAEIEALIKQKHGLPPLIHKVSENNAKNTSDTARLLAKMPIVNMSVWLVASVFLVLQLIMK